jgi:3-phosphoglycerate kinase
MKRSIRDISNLQGKKVLLRVDFNVPLDNNGKISDLTRIKSAFPTIKYLIDRGAKVIICSHMGRPKGYNIRLSLWQVSLVLLRKFPGKVMFSQKTIGPEVKQQIEDMKEGSMLLLENVRFFDEEEANDKKFAKELASLADIFVNDAFGTAHRKHASNYGVAKLLPNAIGFLIENEVYTIKNAIETPKHPFVAVFGGFKIDDKIKAIYNIMQKADTIIIGGAMAYAFLLAQNLPIGRHNISSEAVETAKQIMQKAKELGKKIVLPIDHKVLKTESEKEKPTVVTEIDKGDSAFDIGPKTVKLFKEYISKAKQIIWNGPLGKYEDERFREGSMEIAKAIAKSRAYSIAGGGDTVSAIEQSGVANKIGHISTGGGVTLKLLEGSSLTALEVIQERI